MARIDWYFDFISPFAYLQQLRLEELPEVTYKPILLAGLLHHWGQKGPAEIPAKRTFTYQYVLWYARKHNLLFRCPPAHPFNPLRALRLVLAANNEPSAVRAVFHFIWGMGGDLSDDAAFEALGHSLGVADPVAAIAEQGIKTRLRTLTEQAVDRGVFGVPTLMVDDTLFFGNDATDMALDYIGDSTQFEDGEMLRVSSLPVGASRI